MNRKPRTDDIIISGLMCSVILLVIFLIGLLAFNAPKIFGIAVACIIGFGAFVYISGWCIENRHQFLELFKKSGVSESVIKVDRNPFKNPILEKLFQLENKHHMTTLYFMQYVENNTIPYRMDNLDYIEWVSLVNELPGLSVEKAEENI